MKSFLLTAAMLVAFAGGMFAQNLPPEYSWEVGVNGGYSAITRPVGPPAVYSGTRTNIVKDFSLRASYYLNWRWMLSLDIGTRRWESFGQWDLEGKFGKKLKPVNVNFLLADQAITQSIQLNHVIPFYTQFRDFNRANLYFGVMAGLVNTINDGSRSYDKYNDGVDSGYTYVSGYHYSAGRGYTLGLQTGFIYYIVPRLGVTAELAVRYADVKTFDQNFAAVNNRYQLLHFPQTVGVRWRF
jgi:hypothetical protein